MCNQFQQMAKLPYNSITPIAVCGVDLAGLFNMNKWKKKM